jgi:molybdenum cofactor cytidylyltransferase
MKLFGLIPVAGLSSRMNDFKPLMKINERPIINYSVDMMINAGVQKIVIVLGYRADEVKSAVCAEFGTKMIEFVVNKYYKTTDMLYSIKLAMPHMQERNAFYLTPADMPAISLSTYTETAYAMEKYGKEIVFPKLGEKRGHPALISASFIKNITDYDGEDGLRGLWSRCPEKIMTVKVKDDGCIIDADTYNDYCILKKYMEGAGK